MARISVCAILLCAAFLAEIVLAQSSSFPSAITRSVAPSLRQDSGWNVMDGVRWLIVVVLLLLAAFVAWKVRRIGTHGLSKILERQPRNLKLIEQLRLNDGLSIYVLEHRQHRVLLASSHTSVVQIDLKLGVAINPEDQSFQDSSL